MAISVYLFFVFVFFVFFCAPVVFRFCFEANNVLTSGFCTAGLEQRVHGHPIDLLEWGYRHRQRRLHNGLL